MFVSPWMPCKTNSNKVIGNGVLENIPADLVGLLELWNLWLGVAGVLIVIAYGPVLIELINVSTPVSPPFRVW